jgi:hypothetical protein
MQHIGQKSNAIFYEKKFKLPAEFSEIVESAGN